MKYRMATMFSMLLVMIILAGVASCGGGGVTIFPDPGQQPDPGLQQPDPGQQQQLPPSEPLCEPPDVGKISASFNVTTQQFSLVGDPGAVRPGARVVIEDSQSFVSSLDANPDGSFAFQDGDVPPNFMRQVGAAIDVMQFTPDTRRSDPSTVTTMASKNLGA